MNITAEFIGLPGLIEDWQRAPETVQAELHAATLEATLLLEREVRENTPVGIGGGGGLRGSIGAREPVVNADQVIGVVGTALRYAEAVELGTKPHFPPVQPLADWAQFKLGIPEAQARDVGFLIARKISRVGTEGAFMFRDALDAQRGQIGAIYARAHTRIRDALAAG